MKNVKRVMLNQSNTKKLKDIDLFQAAAKFKDIVKEKLKINHILKKKKVIMNI